ncbi:MAG: hypothetical protein KTR28_02785 [Micavibrio sp.]|nr:hypothetical protein [Micavibrio sp.]
MSTQQFTPQTQGNVFTAPAVNFSRDPNKAMQQMMEMIDDLRGIYVRETEALERLDTHEFVSLQEDKAQRALTYEAGIKEMVSRKGEIRKADNKLRSALNAKQAEFAELTGRNKLALDRMSRAAERLNGAIRQAAKEEVQKLRTFSYGQNGQMDSNPRRNISIGVSEEA